MRYVCPVCQQSIQGISEHCAGCGLLFDPAQWPEEAYSANGMRAKLIISWGNGHEYNPNSDDFQIGRMPEGDGLVLANGIGVSKIHARVFCVDGIWHIQKKSSQPLILNGESVEDEAILLPGAEITIGAFMLTAAISYEQKRTTDSPHGQLCSSDTEDLDADRIYIGSDPTRCRVLISGADPVHALLYKRDSDQSWYAVDCASKSGVKVNDERIRNKKLYPGDEISIAGVDFIFHGDRLTKGQTASCGISLAFSGVSAEVGNGIQILQNLNFHIEQGEFVGILGPSGCGKSSLIQRIVGLAQFTEGEMQINGTHFEKLPAAYLDAVSYQPQQNTLHPDLTLREEISAYRSLHALHGRRIKKETAQKALQLVGLERELNKQTSQLSGGQQRRAGIALALLRDLQMLVLDEPTSGLDPATETEVMGYLKRISNQNKTVICSTHIMGNIEKFDKVLVLSRGHLVFFGTPSELLNFFKIAQPLELYRIFASGTYDEQVQTAAAFSNKYYSSPIAQKYTMDIPTCSMPEAKHPDFAKQVYGYWKRMFFEMISFKNNSKWWKAVWRSNFFIQLFLQPFLVALVLKMACAYNLVSSDGSKEVLFFSAVAVFWLGINNSVRELVKERIPWRCLERLERISSWAYLVSKISWSTVLCLMQTGIFSFFLFFAIPQFHVESATQDSVMLALTTDIFLALALVSITGAWIGLSISAISKKENSAVSFLPIILIPVLFFSQPIIRNNNYSEGIFFSSANSQSERSLQKKNYTKWAVVLERIMPCHTAEVFMDKVNLKRNDPSINISQISAARKDMLFISLFYLMLSLVLMVTFQIKNETDWEGR